MDNIGDGADRYSLEKGGRSADVKRLRRLMQRAYQELSPTCSEDHLVHTIAQLWSEQTPIWFLTLEGTPQQTIPPEDVGCVWLGYGTDHITGDRYAHIFLLYVDPEHRRRGLGHRLMDCAENWSLQQGYPHIGLYVLIENNVAQELYQQRGYCPQALVLKKTL